MEERVETNDVLGEAAPAGRSSGHWVVVGLAVLCVVGLVLLRWVATPDPRGYGTHEQLGLPPCAMVELTGVPCPGCGVTTSVCLAAHGRLAEAFRNQPFGLFVALVSPVFVLWAAWGHVTGKDLHRALEKVRLGWWAIPIGVLLTASWIYKICTM